MIGAAKIAGGSSRNFEVDYEPILANGPLGATALVALSLPAYAVDATLVKSGATPQLSQRADHPAAFKQPKKKQPKKK